MLQPRFLVVGGMILLAAVTRSLPYILDALGVGDVHDPYGMPWNVMPLGAICVFGGAYLSDRRWAMAIPVISKLLADFVVAALMGVTFVFHAITPAVYGGFLLMVWLGTWLQRPLQQPNSALTRILAIAGTGFIAEAAFFLITNFANWALQSLMTPNAPPLYPYTSSGLLACYIAGLPFFKNALLGMTLYGTALFGGYALLQKRVLAPQSNLVEANM